MFRTIVLLCLAAPAFGSSNVMKAGLKMKYGTNMFTMGTQNMIDMPRCNQSASDEGYMRMNRPRLPPGYCSLQLWCIKANMFSGCIFTDETGDVAGVQYNIPVDEFEPKYDMKEQGFTIWTTVLDNEIIRFYAFYLFFVPPDSRKRIASKNSAVILRGGKVYYSGFHGKLASVETEIYNLNSIYTEQNCAAWLGNLYYYNMTKNMECSASTMSPFSAMFDEVLIGVRISVFGTWVKNSKHCGFYEDMTRLSTMYSVPNGPKCFFNDIKKGGASMTIYFIKTPWLIDCGSS